jgi:uncharacterized OB-fold protein
METDYVYTLGVAGEKFFTAMAENERIQGGKCKRCGLVYVPPRLYCEECFGEVTDWVDVGTKGRVFTFTVAYVDVDGTTLKEPIIYALIKFPGAEGGLVHRLGEVEPHKVEIGMAVEAVFKPQAERSKNINDIKHFAPKR